MDESLKRQIHEEIRIRNRSEGTCKLYTFHIGKLLEWTGNKPLKELTLYDAREYIIKKRNDGVTPGSCNTINAALVFFYRYQINPVKVSRRDGINYVFNGQHTIEIVALVSGSRETPVWCMVYEDLEYAEEADIFANQMKYNKPLLPYEIFMANIEAGSDEQILIRDLVESFDLEISSSAHPESA